VTPDELAAIRERAGGAWPSEGYEAAYDRDALLAHIDALTAKVEGLPTYDAQDYVPAFESYTTISTLDRDDVLAVLRGEA